MKDVPLWFPVVPHEDIAFFHYPEVGPFPSKFFFSSILGPFMRADEELGIYKEVLYLFEIKVVNFTRVLYQVQDDGAYSLGINYTPNAIDLCILLFS